MMSLETEKRPTRAYIDLDALTSNFHSAKQFIGPNLAYMAIVKADAYGHGAAACALRLETEGIEWFGVAIPEEGVELRKAGVIKPILCLGSFWPGQERLLVEYQLTPVVYDDTTALRLDRYARENNLKFDIHIKIDTGMGRVGVRHTEASAFAKMLMQLEDLRVTGLLTHFAAAENPNETGFTNLQIERFNDACDAFRAAGHNPEWFDMANSPGAISHPRSRGNLVRLGGALYGLLDDILPVGIEKPEMKPIMSLRSQIAHLKYLPAGESLGYGRTFITKRDSIIALVPIGYADGYPRGLSNRGRAIVNGIRVPVVGRISMDWTLLDVTDIPGVSDGDEVVLIGGEITAADLAHELGTIGYEITCGISPRVPRTYQ
ncbi:MAG: alanine racemase [Pyrinomonadaceae bacterium]